MFAMPYPLAVGGGQDFMGFEHAGSAMFSEAADADYLFRTFGSAVSDDTAWTYSVWFRPGVVTGLNRVLLADDLAAFTGSIFLDTSHRLDVRSNNLGWQRTTTRVFRDPTAWYHLLVVFDSDQVTANDRLRIWINGVEVTAFDTITNGSQGARFSTSWLVNGQRMQIGQNQPAAATIAWDGFQADSHMFDGQAYADPLNFGRFHPVHGEFIPREVEGLTYGNNGWHLDFADPSDLGNDVSGNNNDFTANGSFGAANAFLDVPANTFPIHNSVIPPSGINIAQAGLQVFEISATTVGGYTTHVLPPGKWHFAAGNTGPGIAVVGFHTDIEFESDITGNNVLSGTNGRGVGYHTNGNIYVDGSVDSTVATYGNTDDIDVYIDNTDPASVKVWFAKNGVQQGSGSPDPATGTDPVVTYTNSHPFPEHIQCIPAYAFAQNGQLNLDFGQRRGSEAIIGTTPAGFQRISTGNFPVPLGPALQPKNFFGTITYEGDGAASRTIIDTDAVNFQPDLVILENLDAARAWRVAINMAGFSPSPSTPNNLRTDSTVAAEDFIGGNIEGFNFGGFDVADGSTDGLAVNESGNTFLALCFKHDPAAGLDIVRYAGDDGSDRQIAHDLGVVPELIIVKALDAAASWHIYASNYGRVSDPETDFATLNTNNAPSDDNTVWNDTAPTASEFTVGSNTAVNGSGREFVALVFASIPSFLKIHATEGNANADGLFVPTLFLPRAMYSKRWSAAGDQALLAPDLNPSVAGGDGQNQDDRSTRLHTTGTLQTYAARDMLANGVKMRNSSDALNNGRNAGFIYAEVASKFARAR